MSTPTPGPDHSHPAFSNNSPSSVSMSRSSPNGHRPPQFYDSRGVLHPNILPPINASPTRQQQINSLRPQLLDPKSIPNPATLPISQTSPRKLGQSPFPMALRLGLGPSQGNLPPHPSGSQNLFFPYAVRTAVASGSHSSNPIDVDTLENIPNLVKPSAPPLGHVRPILPSLFPKSNAQGSSALNTNVHRRSVKRVIVFSNKDQNGRRVPISLKECLEGTADIESPDARVFSAEEKKIFVFDSPYVNSWNEPIRRTDLMSMVTPEGAPKDMLTKRQLAALIAKEIYESYKEGWSGVAEMRNVCYVGQWDDNVWRLGFGYSIPPN
ncbi:hypothetical protein BDN70DRAFT_935960 [Pholiota conissans]|uniref:Uncharacterized protein n=1 Tax=Pholiota conissans TaxID=109636 RepID=A0A9P6CQ29_9AGAR|nr:hypothetical protein BDN70DRAFT_935960 [Pholiota conissans]